MKEHRPSESTSDTAKSYRPRAVLGRIIIIVTILFLIYTGHREGRSPVSENSGSAISQTGNRTDEPKAAEKHRAARESDGPRVNRVKRGGAEPDGEHEDDNPDGAREFRRLQMQDEKGRIPRDGMQKAREHVALMRAAREERLRARQQEGLSTEGIYGAGIEPGSWESLGPGNIGGRIRSIVIHPADPNKMWVGSVSGGIWRTLDGGASWAPVNDFQSNLAVSTMAMDPSNPDTMYAGTGEGFPNGDALQGAGIFKTVNGGMTWNQLASTANANFNFVNRVAVSGNGGIILAATNTGVWRSVDGGTTWSQRTNAQALDVDFLGTNNDRAVVGELGNARYSLDGGVTWTNAAFSPPISNGGTPATNGRVELAVHKTFAFDSFVYASVNQNDGDVYRSNDSGRTYTRYSTGANYLGGIGWYTNTIWSNPQDPDNVIVGGVFLWRGTIDFNTNTLTLSQISDGTGSPHADNHVIVEHPGFNNSTNRIAFFGNDGGIYRTNDMATAGIDSGWAELNNTLGITQFYGAAVHNQTGTVVGGTQDNGTLRFTGNSEGWNETFHSDGGVVVVDQTDAAGRYFYGERQNIQLHRSTDGGATASYMFAGIGDACPEPPMGACTPRTNFIAPLALDPINPTTLLAGGWSLWRSIDIRETTPTWASIKNPTGGNSPISAIAISPNTSTLILVGHNNGDLYRTFNGTDGSPAWTQINAGLPSRMVTRIVIDPNHSTNWYYVTFGGFNGDNVWRSTDNGANWTDITGAGATGLPSVPVRTLVVNPINPNFLYVGTEIGIFTSEDGGATWDVSQDGPANVSVDELFFRSDSTLYAATHGRGIYRTTTPVFVPPQVTNVSDSGAGSLRDAISRTSLVTGTERKIQFNLTGGGIHTINVSTQLPTLSNIKLDGWSQGGPGYTGPPLIEINGAGAVGGGGSPVDGLVIGGGTEVNGLTINRFSGAGIKIGSGGSDCVVRGCYIGTNPAGTAAAGNATGIHIFLSNNNRIGRQSFANERNLISGNGVGILIAGLSGQFTTGNRVQGNLIGTDVTGNARLANTQDGVRITDSPSNTIGGTDPLYGNIISGNGAGGGAADGIEITGVGSSGNMIKGNSIGLAIDGTSPLGNVGSGIRIDNAPGTIIGGTDGIFSRNIIADNRNQGGIALINPGSSGTIIQGNYIGTDSTGNVARPNNAYGVYAESGNNKIGDALPGAGNLISGYDTIGGIGIFLFGFAGSTNNVILGNLIGTNAAGTAALSRVGTGIELRGGSTSTTIGGPSPAARNVISGNVTAINCFTSNNIIRGNYIGTNPSGTAALPNVVGVVVDGGANNRIGGDTAGAGNVISGNGTGGNDHGVRLANTNGAVVQGNLIGTNAAGTAALGNGGHGVQVFNSTNCTIGGATAAARNIISANGLNGVLITISNNTTVQNNYIGTDVTGTANLGNGQQSGESGVVISFGDNNTISGNIIANSGCFCFGQNRGSGILIFSGTGNRIESNSIFGNAELGIDLSGGAEGANRVTPNDNCDADTGPNNLQNYPVLTAAVNGTGNLRIEGTLNSTASVAYNLHFYANPSCDAAGNGEGRTYLGTASVVTGANCVADFSGENAITLAGVTVPAGQIITATATSNSGNTSEFSACITVTGVCGAISPSAQSFAAKGGNGKLNVSASASCNWTAASNDSWIVITSENSGTGSGVVTFEVRENPAGERTGTLTIAEQAFTVTQLGSCQYIISPTLASHPAAGGTGSINVQTSINCIRAGVSNANWIIITSPNGTGSGVVTYSVSPNNGPSRTGTITVGGKIFTVKQKPG